MDALKRPLRIPPDFIRYAEAEGIFELYERMLQELITAKPEDPLQFLADYLGRKDDNHSPSWRESGYARLASYGLVSQVYFHQKVPRVIIYGPPASGQNTVSKLVTRKMKTVHVRPHRVVDEDKTALGKEAHALRQAGKELPATLWAQLIHGRLQQKDCLDKGWVLEGFPRTREQALALQAKGVIAKHFVHLEASDSVLVERYAGKRIDPLTGDVYHLVFNPPKSEEVASRLTEEEGGIEKNMVAGLALYHRHSEALLSSYSTVTKTFNADQPITDLSAQVHSFLCTQQRSAAPHTPRVVLLGPTGSGKSLQAAQLAKKYHLVNIDCRELIRQTLVSQSKLADQMKPFHQKNMLIPDDMVMHVVGRRLERLDCASRGWVLHGFPLTRDQAELLSSQGHKPNRVFILSVPEDTVRERLTLRRVDPTSGERYHLLFKPPPSQEIKARLQVHPRDMEERVSERLEFYNSCVEELVEYYSWGQHVNADQDPLTVTECIESMLVNPLPKPPQPTLS